VARQVKTVNLGRSVFTVVHGTVKKRKLVFKMDQEKQLIHISEKK